MYKCYRAKNTNRKISKKRGSEKTLKNQNLQKKNNDTKTKGKILATLRKRKGTTQQQLQQQQERVIKINDVEMGNTRHDWYYIVCHSNKDKDEFFMFQGVTSFYGWVIRQV